MRSVEKKFASTQINMLKNNLRVVCGAKGVINSHHSGVFIDAKIICKTFFFHCYCQNFSVNEHHSNH